MRYNLIVVFLLQKITFINLNWNKYYIRLQFLVYNGIFIHYYIIKFTGGINYENC